MQRFKRRKNVADEDVPREIKNREKAREKTFERAVNLLTYKWRSIAELRERLLEKDWTDAEIVDGVIAKLKDYGYLNDEQFAKDFAASKIRQKPVGKRVLRQKLAQKKIPKDLAEAALEQIFEATPETDLVALAAGKRLRLKGKPETREDTKKFFDYLLRQGFSYSAVSEKMREIAATDFTEEF